MLLALIGALAIKRDLPGARIFPPPFVMLTTHLVLDRGVVLMRRLKMRHQANCVAGRTHKLAVYRMPSTLLARIPPSCFAIQAKEGRPATQEEIMAESLRVPAHLPSSVRRAT